MSTWLALAVAAGAALMITAAIGQATGGDNHQNGNGDALTIVEITAECAPGGVTGTVTVMNTGSEPVSTTLPFVLTQHIPPPRGGQAEWIPVESFTVSVDLDPGETETYSFGPISTAGVDPEANSLRVETDVEEDPSLNPEKSESFGPCFGEATPTSTPTVMATHTPTATATTEATETPPNTPTGTATATATIEATATNTASPTATETTEAATSTPTATETTAAATNTPTASPTVTETPTGGAGAETSTPTASPTATVQQGVAGVVSTPTARVGVLPATGTGGDVDARNGTLYAAIAAMFIALGGAAAVTIARRS